MRSRNGRASVILRDDELHALVVVSDRLSPLQDIWSSGRPLDRIEHDLDAAPLALGLLGGDTPSVSRDVLEPPLLFQGCNRPVYCCTIDRLRISRLRPGIVGIFPRTTASDLLFNTLKDPTALHTTTGKPSHSFDDKVVKLFLCHPHR
jgi:hypothetical protein